MQKNLSFMDFGDSKSDSAVA